MRSNPRYFDQGRPMGSEVLAWLQVALSLLSSPSLSLLLSLSLFLSLSFYCSLFTSSHISLAYSLYSLSISLSHALSFSVSPSHTLSPSLTHSFFLVLSRSLILPICLSRSLPLSRWGRRCWRGLRSILVPRRAQGAESVAIKDAAALHAPCRSCCQDHTRSGQKSRS
jgi:hypothetical protein